MNYGHRFCRRCGKFFEVKAPDDRYCGQCPEAPAAAKAAPAAAPPPPAAVRPQKPRPAPQPQTRPRRSSQARPAITPASGPRTLPILRALADAPAGLTTVQLAEIAGGASSWINALGTTRQLMLKQQRQGRVEQAGTEPGNRTRESVLWRITDEGRRYVGTKTRDQAASDTEPDGVAGDCFYVLLMYGGETPAASDLYERIAREHVPMGWAVPSREQVGRGLEDLASRQPPLVRQAGARWVITDHGYAMFDVWVPDEPNHAPGTANGTKRKD